MNISVRLYWVHDYDLIGLADSPDINLPVCAKKALMAFASGDRDFSILVPDRSEVREVKTNRMFHFRLDPDDPDEKPAYDAYHKLKRGVRNSAIKNMIRMYMDKANFSPYISEPGFKPEISGTAEINMGQNMKTKSAPAPARVQNRKTDSHVSVAKKASEDTPALEEIKKNTLESTTEPAVPIDAESDASAVILDDSASTSGSSGTDTTDEPDIYAWLDKNLG